MSIWEILSELATLDLLPKIGMNWFSVICFCFMALFGLRLCLRFHKPFERRKLPLIMLGAFTALVLHYNALDTTNSFLKAITAQDLSASLWWYYDAEVTGIFNVFIGSRFFYIIMASLVLWYYFKGMLNYRKMASVWLFNAGFMILTVLIFGTHNMRHLTGDARTIFYICSFIPMWALIWAFGYTKIWVEEVER